MIHKKTRSKKSRDTVPLRSLLNGPHYIFGSLQALSRPLHQSADPIGTLTASTRTLMVSRTFSASKSPFHDFHKCSTSTLSHCLFKHFDVLYTFRTKYCDVYIKKPLRGGFLDRFFIANPERDG